MAEIDIKESKWRMVEVGRVVLFSSGAHTDRLAAIVEVIDHKRVLVDGPTSDASTTVPRHAAALRDLTLTDLVVSKVPRAAGTGALKKRWEEDEIEKKWAATAWAKKRDQRQRRKGLSDFERFKVMKLKKQSRFEVRKSVAKIRTSAKK